MILGSHIPSFSLLDQKGNTFNSDEFLYKKYFVLFFYPRNFTPTCTKEACLFRDFNKEFSAVNALVLGVNNQSSNAHEKFHQAHQLNFPLLSDSNGQLRKRLGVKKKLGLFVPRETFVFNKQGKLILHISDLLNADIHIQEAIKAIQEDRVN